MRLSDLTLSLSTSVVLLALAGCMGGNGPDSLSQNASGPDRATGEAGNGNGNDKETDKDKDEEGNDPVRLAGNPNVLNKLEPSDATLRACTASAPRADGKPASFQKTLVSASGEIISFQVFEPSKFDCKLGSPLILHGHGFGGSRQTATSGLIKDLVGKGYGVISIDQRGFGASTGSVRVLDPEFEGRDLLQIMDWAEKNLDWLAYERRRDLQTVTKQKYNLVSGAIGGSYGGGYQLLIHNIDPQHRLDALSPDITWNDLRYSLNPGGVVKTGWALFLVAVGEAGGIAPKLQTMSFDKAAMGGLDPVIRETLVRGAASNNFPAGALNFFRYHSADYFCDPRPEDKMGPITFALDPLLPQQKPSFGQVKPKKVDILFTQGIRDTLFNFNEAWRNVQCYRALGGDVRLMTHESGHILPVSGSALSGQPGFGALFDAAAQAGISVPKFQEPAGQQRCAGHGVDAATLAFFEEKLQGRTADPLLERYKDKACMSLDAASTEAALVPLDQFRAPAVRDTKASTTLMPELDLTTASTLPATQGVLGVATAVFAPTVLKVELPANLLASVKGGKAVLAGIPVATLNLKPIADGLNNPVCTQFNQAVTSSPVGVGGVGFACDPIVYVGIGLKTKGANGWRLVDDQVKPVRGFSGAAPHVVELNGIAEKIGAEDELAVLVYGFHPQFPASWSRDLLIPAVQVSGKVQLPLIDNPMLIKAQTGQ